MNPPTSLMRQRQKPAAVKKITRFGGAIRADTEAPFSEVGFHA
jgi:hypothetical protein